ncbi:MAG: hypothetical protein AAB608_01810 [Patescibacteria group bacterium]
MSFFETFNKFASKVEKEVTSERGKRVVGVAGKGLDMLSFVNVRGDEIGKLIARTLEDVKSSPGAVNDAIAASMTQFDALVTDFESEKKQRALAVRQRTLDAMQKLDAAKTQSEQLDSLEELQADEIIEAGVRATERTSTPLSEEHKEGFRSGIRAADAAHKEATQQQVADVIGNLLGILAR